MNNFLLRRRRMLRYTQLLLLFIAILIVIGASKTIVEGSQSQSHPSNHPFYSSLSTQHNAPKPQTMHPKSSSLDSLYAVEQAPFEIISRTIEISVPLGMKQEIDLTITNTTNETIMPVLYEALPLPALGVTPPITLTSQLQRIQLPVQEERVDPQILSELSASPDGKTKFLVLLHDQPDLSEAYTIADWTERGEFVYRTLTRYAKQSQQALRAWLDDEGISYRSHWIVNALAVEGSYDDVAALEKHADVAMLRANHTMSLGDNTRMLAVASCDADANGVCWNINTIGADDAWYTFGVSGQGIVVANLDSGVSYTHPALKEQYRGYNADGSYSHDYNWFDVVYRETVPADAGNHGSHTMGTMVGRGDGSATQPAVGVAPGARWIAVRGCGSSLCDESDLIAAAEWFLAPTDQDGENPRPSQRPHIINNSWAAAGGDEDQYVDFTVAWRASGIFPVFAAGNTTGIKCGSIASPGDYRNVVAVGATDRSDGIAYFSRVGPTSDGRIKPDITAPGQSIASSYAGSGLSYGTLNGTSMAAPHVAGAVALLWSANPALIGDYDATYAILIDSATPRTDSRYDSSNYPNCPATSTPNNIYGYGRLDAYAAVAEAQVDVNWLDIPHDIAPLAPGESRTIKVMLNMRVVPEPDTYVARMLISTGDLSYTPQSVAITSTVTATKNTGTISGTIIDAQTGSPLSADVSIVDGPEVQADMTGTFSMTLPAYTEPTTYMLNVEAVGYVNQTAPVSLTAGMQRHLSFAMIEEKPVIDVQTSPITPTLEYGESVSIPVTIRNVGTLPLQYTASIPLERFGVWRSDEDDGIANNWIELPSNSTTLDLNDDDFAEAIPLGFTFPLNEQEYDTIAIGSNGMLVFGTINKQSGFVPNCTPIPDTDGAAILPLRMDLDPAQGGMVRYATRSEGFVVSYEAIPIHGEKNSFSFQVVLQRDGNIVFNYQSLDDIPNHASVGIQYDKEDQQMVGCGTDTPITSSLSLQFHPQPASQTWLALDNEEEKNTLEPGEHDDIQTTIRWTSAFFDQPYRGAVEIESNDPYQETVRIPVELTTLPYFQDIVIDDEKDTNISFTLPDGLLLNIEMQATSVAQETIIRYTQAPEPTDRPENYSYAGHSFTLEAYQDGQLVSTLSFDPSFTVTLGYDDAEMNQLEEQHVRLFALQGTTWRDATVAAYDYNTERNLVTITLDKPGQFALFYEDMDYMTYCPLVMN